MHNPVKHLKWNVLRKYLTVFSRWLFHKKFHLRCFTGSWIRFRLPLHTPSITQQRNIHIISLLIFTEPVACGPWWRDIRFTSRGLLQTCDQRFWDVGRERLWPVIRRSISRLGSIFSRINDKKMVVIPIVVICSWD